MIIVTVREPAEAMFSYFVQLYPRFRKLNMSFESLARNHESMEIFHYGKLIRELESNFCANAIRFFPFEKIVNNELIELSNEIICCEQKQQTFALGHRNSRRKDGKSVLRIEQRGFGSVISDWLAIMRVTTILPSPIKTLLKPLRARLDIFAFNKKSAVSQPSFTEVEQLRDELFVETQALERFGVSFNDN